jgi:hypothetical protein
MRQVRRARCRGERGRARACEPRLSDHTEARRGRRVNVRVFLAHSASSGVYSRRQSQPPRWAGTRWSSSNGPRPMLRKQPAVQIRLARRPTARGRGQLPCATDESATLDKRQTLCVELLSRRPHPCPRRPASRSSTSSPSTSLISPPPPTPNRNWPSITRSTCTLSTRPSSSSSSPRSARSRPPFCRSSRRTCRRRPPSSPTRPRTRPPRPRRPPSWTRWSLRA